MLHCNPEFLHVVRPKTPRGDGNHRGSPALDHAPLVVSSDPKPREGTETFCLMLGRQLLTKSSDPKPREGTETRKRRASSDRLLAVRPKTPRGDGNSRRGMARQAWLGGRQTQNPERGRKHVRRRRKYPTARVVRPKTPRGDGNPYRGRRRCERTRRVVRPKTPRGDGNYTTRRAISQRPPRRQTQNPERGRKLEHGAVHMPWLRGVVRPKTLNRPGMSGDSSSWKGWGHVRWFIEEVPAGAA